MRWLDIGTVKPVSLLIGAVCETFKLNKKKCEIYPFCREKESGVKHLKIEDQVHILVLPEEGF